MANKGQFTPGDPRAGRKVGATNLTGREARAFAQRLLSDPAYEASLKERLLAGKLGDLEKVLWHYAFGAPPSHPVSHLDDFLERLQQAEPPAPESPPVGA
jgi:hypothetical protein